MTKDEDPIVGAGGANKEDQVRTEGPNDSALPEPQQDETPHQSVPDKDDDDS
jgi:hypothetical protein